SLVEFCYSFSTVYGFSCTGGLLGYQSTGTVKNSYARGNVTGLGNSVGGLVGGNLLVGNLERCYSTGLVTAQPGSMAGGLLGSQLNQSNTINSFWDMETSGMLSSGGSEIGKTTAEMTYPYVNTYVGWNFSSTWRDDSLGEYNDRYPILFWQLPVNPPQAPDAP
ncbi:MAG: GLUG motif-containing protein, partial [Candidatus Cloacimonetes bacterium]|nr:GLUG motif-containing protein [Candidatus Cloacimonadota bacterium]